MGEALKRHEEFLKSYSNNKKKIKINFEFEDSKLNIFANQNKLAQVFYNILDNSISYSSIESSILIKQSIRDNFIIIHIVDQGPGIPLNLSNKIFQRFYSDRAKDRDQHSGLGLSIAMKIVESFQGSLSLIKNNYQSYQGACFEINFPLKEKTKNL